MIENILSIEKGKELEKFYDQTILAVESIAMDAIESFNIPDELLNAPISQNWIKYNDYDNQGKRIKKKKFFFYLLINRRIV